MAELTYLQAISDGLRTEMRRDKRVFLIGAIEDPNPVLYFEHKHLYRRIKAEVPEERYTTPIGKARIHREGSDVSVITWGAMVYTADEAAQQLDSDGVSVEIVDLRTVMPWDKAAVLESVRKTSKVLVLHEDTRSGGFGGEIAATIAEEAFEDLDGPVKRLAAPDTPVPFSPPLEKAYIPQVEDVVAGLRELAEYLEGAEWPRRPPSASSRRHMYCTSRN